jgi:hypothetical protein
VDHGCKPPDVANNITRKLNTIEKQQIRAGSYVGENEQ